MSDAIEIQPVLRPVRGTIRPPGSKSITNRALVCAALADGSSRLTGVLQSEDTLVMIEALQALGIAVDVNESGTVVDITGCGGNIPTSQADLFVANSGTTVRFLTAMVALGHGRYRLDGTKRMRERPIADLIDGLRQLGVSAACEAGTRCPPVVVEANGMAGGEIQLRGEISSQYLSGLLMAASYAESDTVIQIAGPLVSEPYVDMTIAVMRQFGVDVTKKTTWNSDGPSYHVPANSPYQARTYTIEPDASGASYFWAAAAITAGMVTVEGLSRDSLQGDVEFCDCLSKMGCDVEYGEDRITVTGRPLSGITVDMGEISDTAQTLSAVALFADGPTTITGIGHNRHKETDRIGNLAIELRQLGAKVDELKDGLRITPVQRTPARIKTYNDHRMAMSLALVGLRTPGVLIEDPRCTEKTYPQFFDDLTQLCAAH